MNKVSFFRLVFSSIFVVISFCFLTFNVRAISSQTIDAVDKQQIEKVINNYFETRGQSLKICY